LPIDTVERMTITQVLNAFNGYYDREKERAKVVQIVGWETIRWQTFILWNLQVTKKSRINDPKKLIKFEWDSKPEQITKEQWDEINKKFPDKLRNGNR